MASLSSLGVGSGLDAETIVTKLVALEKQPADALTTKNTKLKTKGKTYFGNTGANKSVFLTCLE